MIELFRELFAADFLLKHALWATLLLGAVAPLAGCFLLLRRAAFLGVALPQVSAAGVTGGGLVLALLTAPPAEGEVCNFVPIPEISLLCATGAALAALLLLAWLERRSGTADARHGVLYALAGAGAVLMRAANPHAEHTFSNLFSGDVVSLGANDLRVAALALVPAAVVLVAFRHEFLWAGCDGDFMAAAGRRVLFWNALLLGTIGVVIGAVVYLVGPLICFGALLLPAVAAWRLARRMEMCFVFAPLIGVVGALIGFSVAYRMDLPAGVTIVAVHGVVLCLVLLLSVLPLRKSAG
ncbi:MAG: metal ABC transporter permease [Puniceicoccales bacterium]|jgi:zinc transport system permease protein|nr:metal ABC transporter permease [Puniceicoccales bacterium]